MPYIWRFLHRRIQPSNDLWKHTEQLCTQYLEQLSSFQFSNDGKSVINKLLLIIEIKEKMKSAHWLIIIKNKLYAEWSKSMGMVLRIH